MIKEFKDNYRWLSNFYPCKIPYNGIEYNSVEHAYQSEKSSNPEWKELCKNIKSPGTVKMMSNEIEINRQEWDKKKLQVMEKCLTIKYDQEPFKSMLITTGDEELQEGNTWHDTFWGVDLKTGHGLNHLGKLIMLIRDRLNGKIW